MAGIVRYTILVLGGLFLLVLVTAVPALNNETSRVVITPDVSLVEFAGGFSQPLGIVNSGVPGDDRLFIVEKEGLIRILQSDGDILPTVVPPPFLDVSTLISTGSEQGLLGLAFHPNYADNGFFFINYTDTNGDTRIARYTVSGDPDLADPDSGLIILSVTQLRANHNGGDLKFGPDGYLYVGLGDSGGGGDPDNSSQDMGELLGKMLRLDVDSTEGIPPDCGSNGHYSIPPDNPFVEGFPDTCNEIWASGLRNPWRFSFDRLLGDLYIADVGQDKWEEVNWQPANSSGGENYGWRCYEGNEPFNLAGCGPPEQYTFPVHDYTQSQSRSSITGGFVYRGVAYPVLWGYYLFGDYVSGRIWALYPDGDGSWQVIPLEPSLPERGLSSFGEDIRGELYVSHLGNGIIYRVQENTPLEPQAYLPFIQR
jgi:glucose/arabinose dehydrogenase